MKPVTPKLNLTYSGRVLPMDLKQQLTQFQLDGFAKKYFAEHRRGIFRRRVPVEKMMVYQKVGILFAWLERAPNVESYFTYQMLISHLSLRIR